MEKIIIASFAGTGKTYLGKKYKNVIDLEPAPYKWIFETEENKIEEKDKGKAKMLNPQWPMNYVNKIIESLNDYDIVLIGLNRESREMLEKMGYKYYLCFPNKNKKDEYLRRFVERGNCSEFLEKQAYYFDKELPLLYEENMEKMILDGSEFIEDYLLRNGYTLIKEEND